jgi:hypothetical protein
MSVSTSSTSAAAMSTPNRVPNDAVMSLPSGEQSTSEYGAPNSAATANTSSGPMTSSARTPS